MFVKADTDMNGVLNGTEVSTYIFNKTDKNNDGLIDFEEVKQATKEFAIYM